ncbi:Fe-only nitrogenase accessory AnfO family protein [Methanospirillum stamsii]|uniref:Nitrogenase n=1 Tax=Methanospirillum stamsii TaxID=1277351 RepID=A0A2V2MU89_9EURY|nr:Fe-only nitrogenase accessory AnfO family protein [Methanospirillum stamsii]PWR69880.1 nitrogenase [Methanospirillum stamsii]
MYCEIAAILGFDGMSSTLTESGTVAVFRRNQGVWNLDREMPFNTTEKDSLAILRKKMVDLIGFLGECKIFVANQATGALYYELMKAGCSVFEVSGKPVDFLEEILLEEEQEQAKMAAIRNEPIPGPYERAPGDFFVSIKEIQGKTPGITSKQILLDFMREGTFKALEIICDHIPPWIEMESEQRGYMIESENIRPNEVKMMVRNKSR